MNLNELRRDCAVKQKRGIHFILASVIIWAVLVAIHSTDLPILTKNLLTFCSTAPLLPMAYVLSRPLKIDFQNANNPLTGLGILFSINQMLYLLIAIWVYAAVPDRMLTIIAMIFGAHLLPYGWLYLSRVYSLFAVAIPIAALVIGTFASPAVLAGAMMLFEAVFSLLLHLENRDLGAPAGSPSIQDA